MAVKWPRNGMRDSIKRKLAYTHVYLTVANALHYNEIYELLERLFDVVELHLFFDMSKLIFMKMVTMFRRIVTYTHKKNTAEYD